MPAHKTSEAQVTTDHKQIRQWVEARGGKPAAVKATHRGDDPGILRIIFPGAPNANEASLEEITWDEFFEKFDEAGLAFLHQDETAEGEQSLFNKLIGRETAGARRHGETRAPRHRRR